VALTPPAEATARERNPSLLPVLWVLSVQQCSEAPERGVISGIERQVEQRLRSEPKAERYRLLTRAAL
jgi:hypothetical protein